MTAEPTLDSLAAALAAGRTSASDLVESCLAAIGDAGNEGDKVFISVDAAGARAAAGAADAMRRAGMAPSPWAGIPIAVKDLFDMQGQVTRAGSKALAGAAPATADAPAIARLRRMGFVPVGRANMTEFAYSGLGLNPHYGTPRSIWQRDEARVPGGSSSGSALAVATGMAHAGIGTDTGGSCRIPAAFNNLVGYKPTASAVPRDGVVPLSTSLDSVGPLARSVACCALLHQVMAGQPPAPLPERPVRGLRLAVPANTALDDIDGPVGAAFERCLTRLADHGAMIEQVEVPEFGEIAAMNVRGGFTAAESFAWHRHLLDRHAAAYDPRVLSRIRGGADFPAADYIALIAARRGLVARARARFGAFDALLMPTTPVVPPRIADLAGDEAFTIANLRVLRNPTLINMIDGCAASVPMTAPGEPPAGLMVCGLGGADETILAVSRAIETLLAA